MPDTSADANAARGRAPLALIVPAMVALAFLVIPVIAVFVKAPWGDVFSELGSGDTATALRLSLETTLATLALCVVLGVPLAWVLARVEFRGRSLVRAVVLLPLVLPPVVAGVALLQALGRRGMVGQYLDLWFGITLPFTTTAVVIAQTFVALPFMVISVEGAFRASDMRYDDAAATLGSTRWHTFLHVTLPIAMPGIVAGGVLAWARALGEFGATVTFAGNFPGTTRTMPTQVYVALQSSPDGAIALSLVMIVVSVAILALLRERWLTGVST